jgi:peptidyl-prolyl cis-trans isomerase SurA
MRWHRLAAVGGFVLGACAAGCESAHDFALTNVDPKSLIYSADETPHPEVVSRSQKPDHEPVTLAKPKPKKGLDEQPMPTGDAAGGQIIVSIRAIVNDVPIFDEEVRNACAGALSKTRELPDSERTRAQAEILHSTLEQLVERDLIIQDAMNKLNQGGKRLLEKVREAAGKEFDRQVREIKKQTGVKTDEDFQELLRSQGISLDGMRRQSERQFIAQEYLRSRVMPFIDAIGHEQILEYYVKHPEEFQAVDSVKWQDIFIDGAKPGRTRPEAKLLAEQMVERLNAGADFADYLKYDDGDSVVRQGMGYGSLRGEIQPREAEPILFKMKDGDISPLLEMPTGFHIIKLVNREYAGKMKFDEKAQTVIRDKLRKEIANRESLRIINELKGRAQIEYGNTAP